MPQSGRSAPGVRGRGDHIFNSQTLGDVPHEGTRRRCSRANLETNELAENVGGRTAGKRRYEPNPAKIGAMTGRAGLAGATASSGGRERAATGDAA